MLKVLVFLLRALTRPVLVGTLLAFALYGAVGYAPAPQAVRQAGEVLISGLTGFWTASWRRHGRPSLVLLAGLLAAMTVAALQAGLTLVLGATPVTPLALELARAGVAGMTGAWVARLLHQRVDL
jgi:hypothetical protein